MKIALLTPSLHGGGAERVVRRWARSLRDRGHDITLMTYIHGAYAEHEPEDLGLEGTTRHHFPAAGWASFPRWVRRTALDADADVLLSVLTFSNLAALMAFPRATPGPAVVISERNPLSPLLRTEGRSGRAKLSLARVLYRRAAGAIAISHPVAADLASLYAVDPERLFVVPNPVFTHLPPDESLPPFAAGGRLVFVGRHVPQKNPHLVVDAVEVLQRAGADVACTIYGDGPMRPELEASAASRGLSIEFPGWTENWQQLMRSGDCFLLPSLVEGFGNVLVEAAARNVPVVAPAQALGIADAIVPGISGIIALSARPEHLAAAVRQAWAIRPRSETLGSWQRWFGLENSVDRLEASLATICAERR